MAVIARNRRPPGAWREILEHRLDERWRRIAIYDAYREGDHRLQFTTKRWNEAFAGTFGKVVDNFMPTVIKAYSERMEVQGFRFGTSKEADDAAWDIWQENDCDAASMQIHDEMLTLEEAYWLVDPDVEGDDAPRVTPEHPAEVIVAYAPGDRTVVDAGLKKWADDDGYAFANVYLPEVVHKYRSEQPLKRRGGMTGGRINWVENGVFEHGLGRVPLVPAANDPTMIGGGRSELSWGLIGLQDAINQIISNLLIGAEYLAFPQRVLLGVEVPKDPITGLPTTAAQMQATQSRVWISGNPDAKVAEFSAADLQNYTRAKEALIEDLATQARLPAPYVKAEAQNVSAEALRMTQDGLVRNVRLKCTFARRAHETMMRLAFKAQGDETKANDMKAQAIWRDPETRSQQGLADALVKLRAIGVPEVVCWEKYGFSPQEIERMSEMREKELAEQQARQELFAMQRTGGGPTGGAPAGGGPPISAEGETPPGRNGRPGERIPAGA